MISDIRIGSKLKILRDFRNLSQDDVAAELGISQNAYSRLETNQTTLSAAHAEKLAGIFNVSITDLLSKDNPIISFNYKDSVTVENGYVNNKFEMSKDAFDAVMQSKENENTLLKEQIKNQQEQINSLTSLLGGHIKGSKE